MIIGLLLLQTKFSEYLQIWNNLYNTKLLAWLLGMKSYEFCADQLIVYLQLFVYFGQISF